VDGGCPHPWRTTTSINTRPSGALDAVTYKPAEGEADLVENARNVIRKLIKYAESRHKGEEIASKILQDSNLTTLSRKRSAKLIAAMGHALGVIEEYTSRKRSPTCKSERGGSQGSPATPRIGPAA
jgi:hypothetical protein